MVAFHLMPSVFLYLGLGPLAIASAQVCGIPSVSNRIVGGKDAVEGAWPWQVSLQFDNGHICGGSVITENWIVSAAHCYYGLGYSQSRYTACVGEYQLSYGNPNAVCSRIQTLIIHPSYTVSGGPGDIMLMALSTPLTFTNYVMPICLPTPSVQLPSGAECWTTGWGAIHSSVPLSTPKTLQQVMVPIIDRSTCDAMYHIGSTVHASNQIIKSDMICAGYQAGGKDSCQGDSGGPLACKAGDSWFLAGVVSWGTGCAQANRPGVYTLVTAYNGWIQEQVPDVTFHHYILSTGHSSNIRIMTSTFSFFLPFLLLLLLNAF
ncbi:serine protease 27-like [Ambystoma mexicanum]|uniref:serine protease 27-like n=1 Tax=Ambystoma mexicanum TaxID=8296 RepID=UPI0037E96489